MSKQDINLFEQYLFEAPGDEAPDANMGTDNSQTNTPDTASNSPSPNNEDPPAIDGTPDDTDMGGDDGPPDMGGDDFGTDDFGTDDASEADNSGDEASQSKIQGLDGKVSAIMNHTLYKRFLVLLSQIASQQTSIRNNSDILYSITADTAGIVKTLAKLEENIRIYLRDSYINMNYTRNLLFFNKCINLLNLTNQSFDQIIRSNLNDPK
jgi:hypothetical protein